MNKYNLTNMDDIFPGTMPAFPEPELLPGEFPHDGEIVDPEIRQVPDDICNQLGLPIDTLIKKDPNPFPLRELIPIPIQFWELVKAPQFYGLTAGEIYLIKNCWDYIYRDKIISRLNTNEGIWKHLRELFVQSHPDIDISIDKEYIVIRKWLNKNIIDCFNTFYNLCHQPELPQIHTTDIGDITGYAYIIIAVPSHYDTREEVVCVTTDLSHAEQVAEYLCTVVSLLNRGVDVTLPEEIDHIHKYIEDIRIHRVPVILGTDQNVQSVSLLAKCTSLPIEI